MSVQQPPQQQHLVQQAQQQQRTNTKSIGNYILGRTIGEGTFGKVKLGRHILSGANVAVKVLQKDRIVEVADVERVAREVHILKLIRHPHVVQLFEIIETRGQLYLIMEYAPGGEVFDHIVARGRIEEPQACRLFHQIIAGVEKIHQMKVVHRDLKPENLLLDEHNQIKIVDFGLSNIFHDGQRLSTACGSPCYAPPEMVAGQQYVPEMCDLWSCGVILFAMVCGFLPFEDQNTAALYKKILAADYRPPSFISDAVRDLIAGLLTVDPVKRHTVPEIRRHPWYRQCPEASTPPQDVHGGTASFDEEVLQELEACGFPRDYAVRCLELNKHNNVTTTYWLLLEKKKRMMGHTQKAVPEPRADVAPEGSTIVSAGGQQHPDGDNTNASQAAHPPDFVAHSHAMPVAAWSQPPGSTPSPVPMPMQSPRATPRAGTVPLTTPTTPRLASPAPGGPQRRDTKTRSATAASGPAPGSLDKSANSTTTQGSISVQGAARRVTSTGLRSTTPPVSARAHTAVGKPITTPRGPAQQPQTARAGTPQSPRVWRQPAPAAQPATHARPGLAYTMQPASHSGAVSPIRGGIPAEETAAIPAATVRSNMVTPRLRPPVPAAACPGVAAGQARPSGALPRRANAGAPGRRAPPPTHLALSGAPRTRR